MWERWGRLDRRHRIVVLLAVTFVVFRAALAAVSSFGFHQGWNEGHYALIARGFLDHPIVPHYADRYVYSVPPLFPYLVSLSFLVLGPSTFAARFPSVVAGGVLVVATFGLGRTLFDGERTPLLAAGLIATLPYVQLYAGRAQTDLLMTCLATVAVLAIVRGYQTTDAPLKWLALGGVSFAAAFAAKQPAAAIPGIVLLWLIGNRRLDASTVRRTGVLIAASAIALLPLVAWFYVNYTIAPSAFVTDWQHELAGRTEPFANVPLLLAIGFGLGMTPPVLVAMAAGVYSDLEEVSLGTRGGGPSILTWWLALYGLFVFARTPHGHQYYAVALAPPIGLLAADGVRRLSAALDGWRGYGRATLRGAFVILLLASTVTGSAVLFELSGEFSVANGGGTRVASDAGEYVRTEVPDDATVLVENGYSPPLMWYTRSGFRPEQIRAYHTGTLDTEALRTAVNESEGPVYLVYPRPSWGPPLEASLSRQYVTEPYEFTLMALAGSYVEVDSKFTFYLQDRRLVVYRVEDVPESNESAPSLSTVSIATQSPSSER